MFDLEEVVSKLPERFVSKFVVGFNWIPDRPDLGPCLLWTARVTDDGYGEFWYASYVTGKPGQVKAHRFGYTEINGRPPQGNVLDHLCFNRSCVNPFHVRPVTNLTNTARRVRKNETGFPGVDLHKKNNKYRWRYGFRRGPGGTIQGYGFADARSAYIDRIRWIRENRDPNYLDDGYEWVLAFL